jgi:hypothetical protein
MPRHARGVERTGDRSDQRRGIDLIELEPGDVAVLNNRSWLGLGGGTGTGRASGKGEPPWKN